MMLHSLYAPCRSSARAIWSYIARFMGLDALQLQTHSDSNLSTTNCNLDTQVGDQLVSGMTNIFVRKMWNWHLRNWHLKSLRCVWSQQKYHASDYESQIAEVYCSKARYLQTTTYRAVEAFLLARRVLMLLRKIIPLAQFPCSFALSIHHPLGALPCNNIRYPVVVK